MRGSNKRSSQIGNFFAKVANKGKKEEEDFVVSSPSSPSSPQREQKIPVDLQERFEAAAGEMNIPLEAQAHLSPQQKLGIVLEFESKNKMRSSQELVQLFASQPARLGDPFAGLDVSALERFVDEVGVVSLVELFQHYVEVRKSSDNVSDCVRCLRRLAHFDSGITAMAKDAELSRLLLCSMDLVGILTRISVLQLLSTLAFNHVGVLALFSALERYNADGRSEWTRLCGMLIDCENNDLRIAIIMLIQSVLKNGNASFRKKVIAVLLKNDVPNVLNDLLQGTTDKSLQTLIEVLISMCPELKCLSENEKERIRKSDEASRLFQSLNSALKVTEGEAFLHWVRILADLSIFEKGGDVGSQIWARLADFVRRCSETPVESGDAEKWFAAVIKSFSEVSKPTASHNVHQAQLEKMSKTIDDLTYRLQQALAAANNNNGQQIDGVAAPVAPPKPKIGTPKLPPKQQQQQQQAPVVADSSEAAVVADSSAPPPPPPPPGPSADGGFAPPPPPPPPGGPVAAKKKPVVASKTKLRGLAWVVVPQARVNGSVFDGVDDFAVMQGLPLDKLEQLFGGDSANKVKPEATNVVSVSSQEDDEDSKTISLLDPKRSNNVTIMLSRFKARPLTELRWEIVSGSLGLEDLQLIRPHLPTPEDAAALNAYEGNKMLLAKAERFYCELLTVPSLEQHFDALIFRHSFAEKSVSAQKAVASVLQATRAVVGSASFRRVIELLLAVGNFLNGSSFRGSAYAFKLSSLELFCSSKGNDGRTTVLDVLVLLVREKHPDVLTFLTEMECLQQTSDINVQQVLGDVNSLESGLQLCREVSALMNIDSNVVNMLKTFVAESESVVNTLKADCQAMKSVYGQMCAYVCEDCVFGESEQVFKALCSFWRAFVAADRRFKLQQENAKKGASQNVLAELKAKQQKK